MQASARKDRIGMELKYKRVSLKLSGEAMGGSDTVDFEAVERIAADIKTLNDAGVQVGVTIGGGNIWRGRSAGDMDRNKADQMGMLATAINSLAMEAALRGLGVPCKVLSSLPMERVCDTFTSQRAEEAFAAGKVVLFACGSGLPFFPQTRRQRSRLRKRTRMCCCLRRMWMQSILQIRTLCRMPSGIPA